MTSWEYLEPNPERMAQIKSAFEAVASDKPCHSYERVYAALLPEEVRSILEVGISNYGGEVDRGCGSLYGWRKLYPNSEIIGVDREADRMMEAEKITTLLADQGSDTSMENLGNCLKTREPFDLIIDDASHKFWNGVRTFKNLFPLVKSGGIYFIEDIARTSANEWQQAIADWDDYLIDKGLNYKIYDARPEVGSDLDSIILAIRKP